MAWKRPQSRKRIATLHGYNASIVGTTVVFVKRRYTRRWDKHDSFRRGLPFSSVLFDPGESLQAEYAVSTFLSTCLIVGYHGAGLGNAILSRSPVVVVEITVRRYDNNRIWRSNCKALKGHPVVTDCIVFPLQTRDLDTNRLWHLTKHGPDQDHAIKNLPNVHPSEKELSRLRALIIHLQHKYCSKEPGFDSAQRQNYAKR